MALQMQAIDIFQAVEVNDKVAVRQWLRSKPNVELLNEQGQSLLHVAVQAGNRTLVKDLLKKKIDVNLIDQFGKTAMDYAVELGEAKIILSLAKYKAMVTLEDNLSKVKGIRGMRNMSSRRMLTSNLEGKYAILPPLGQSHDSNMSKYHMTS